MNHNRSSPTPVNTRFPIPAPPDSGMILRDHQHLLLLNRLAVEIHTTDSLAELAALVAGKLPITLNAEVAFWSEHGPVDSISRNRIRSPTTSPDAILTLVLANLASSHSQDPLANSRHDETCGANLGVYDVAALISSSHRSGASDFLEIDHEMQPPHQIVTQFFVTAHRGILLTVQNSRPFTAEQKFTLSLLRDHLTVAARRHYRCESSPVCIKPIPGDPDLSRREQEVLPHLVKGFTNPEIASSLGISPRTVEKHVASILDKAGLDNRRMLIGLASFPTHENTPAKNG